jgi:hypothetical protein
VKALLGKVETAQEPHRGGEMGATHFRLRTLEKVKTEMSLHVLAYNLKRMIALLGVQPLIQAIKA